MMDVPRQLWLEVARILLPKAVRKTERKRTKSPDRIHLNRDTERGERICADYSNILFLNCQAVDPARAPAVDELLVCTDFVDSTVDS